MGERQMAAPPVTGELARALAAHVEAAGYQVQFPSGRDPAMFTVTGVPGGPQVEVTAGEDGNTGCFYMGRTLADAAQVIGRLPERPGHPDVEISALDDVAVEWNYLPPDGRPADPGQIAELVLAHLAVIAGRPERAPLTRPATSTTATAGTRQAPATSPLKTP